MVDHHIIEVGRVRGGPDRTGKRWGVTIIEEGVSLNNRLYTARVLEDAAPLFEGVWAMTDHPSDKERRERPEGSVEKRAGFFENVRVVTEGGKRRIDADFVVILPWLREALLNAWEAKRVDWAGFSINALAKDLRPSNVDGKRVDEVLGIEAVESVDVVTIPAAGGSINALLEAAQHGGKQKMDEDTARKMIAEAAAQAAEEAAAKTAAEFRAALNEAVDRVETEVEEARAQMKEEFPPAKGDAPPAAPSDEEEEGDEEEEAPPAQEAKPRRVRTTKTTKHISVAQEGSDQPETEESTSEETIEVIEALRRLERRMDSLAKANDATKLLNESGLSDASKEIVAKQARRITEAGGRVTEKSMKQLIEDERTRAQAAAPANAAGTARVTGMQMPNSRYVKALEGMFTGQSVDGERPFRSIHEAYHRFPAHASDPWSASAMDIFGALRSDYDSERDNRRLTESLETASWGQVMADVMYQLMLRRFAELPYQGWRKFASYIEPLSDTRSRHWIRTGYYGNIPQVAEGAPYQPLTSPTDEEATYAPYKYGGLEDVTMEAILNDKVGVLQRIPNDLAYGMARTVYEAVMDVLTINNAATTYDSVTLYHSGHSNTDTKPLSVSGVWSTQLAMRKQTPYNAPTTEYLGERNTIRYVVVPPDLMALANRIFNPSQAYVYGLTPAVTTPGATIDTDTNLDPWMWKGQAEVFVYDKLTATDTNDWYAFADPKLVDLLVIGFLNGRDTPELFVQDQAVKAGSAWSADKVSYKIRMFWGIGVLDHRGAFRNVAS